LLNRRGLLDRKHLVVLGLHRENYHNFQSQHDLRSVSDAQASSFGYAVHQIEAISWFRLKLKVFLRLKQGYKTAQVGVRVASAATVLSLMFKRF